MLIVSVYRLFVCIFPEHSELINCGDGGVKTRLGLEMQDGA